jgi:hypothetical protein
VERCAGSSAASSACRSSRPGLYFPSAAFTEDKTGLVGEQRQLAELHGRALVELTTAVRSSKWLRDLRPLV